jgi:hypothetical protein
LILAKTSFCLKGSATEAPSAGTNAGSKAGLLGAMLSAAMVASDDELMVVAGLRSAERRNGAENDELEVGTLFIRSSALLVLAANAFPLLLPFEDDRSGNAAG